MTDQQQSISIAHIVNTFSKGDGRHERLQEMTLSSMLSARDFSTSSVKVELFAAQDPESEIQLPRGFFETEKLTQSIQDVGNFSAHKKLPLLNDILVRLYEASRSNIFIYTNIDIILRPNFYQVVSGFFSGGYDAVVVNRRNKELPENCINAESLPALHQQVGTPHPGIDCVAFKRNIFPKFILGNICIGIPKIGAALFDNVEFYSNNLIWLKNVDLTAHIGDRRDSWWWSNKMEAAELTRHNDQEYKKIALYKETPFKRHAPRRLHEKRAAEIFPKSSWSKFKAKDFLR